MRCSSLPTSPLLILSMPSKRAGGANKIPAKALSRKEAAAMSAAMKLSAKKAASGNRTSQSSGNPPASAASSADPDPEDQAAEIMILRGAYWAQ